MDCTIYVAKTKAAQLIFAIVFAYAKIRFSHDAAPLVIKDNSFTLSRFLNWALIKVSEPQHQNASTVETQISLVIQDFIVHVLKINGTIT